MYKLTGKEKKGFKIVIKRNATLMPNKAGGEREIEREKSNWTDRENILR